MEEYKILIVGCGGIGCEVLKCLAYSGFKNIDIIDKDIIELSNLNRQFLFKKNDVGRSKSIVAKENILTHFKDIQIHSYFSDIISNEFNIHFYQKYQLVINALDNRETRSYVNSMCVAASIPFVDGGTTGYLGQVTVHIKGVSECYDCLPHDIPTTYPVCTIRNNPSKYIHCVVWAKNLLENLSNPNNIDSNPKLTELIKITQNTSKIKELFIHLFVNDIDDLIQMKDLWKSHQPPKKLDLNLLDEALTLKHHEINLYMYSKELFDIRKCISIMSFCASFILNSNESHAKPVEFDKNSPYHVCFVSSAATIRANLFDITPESFFDTKGMAGKIIPAIVTTNDIIASILVIQAIKVLKNEQCKNVYLSTYPMSGKVMVPQNLSAPNPDCYVCSSKPTIYLRCDPSKLTVKELYDQVLINKLGIISSEVIIDDKTGSILISCDQEETSQNLSKTLSYFNIIYGSILLVENCITDKLLKIIIDINPSNELFQISNEKAQNIITNHECPFIDSSINTHYVGKKRKRSFSL